MSDNIKVTLPEEFSPEKRAYFYQSLAILNNFFIPGTTVDLKVLNSEPHINNTNIYNLVISFNNSIVKTSTESDDYQQAIKRMMGNLEGKFAEIMKMINKREKQPEKKQDVKEESEDKKIIH